MYLRMRKAAHALPSKSLSQLLLADFSRMLNCCRIRSRFAALILATAKQQQGTMINERYTQHAQKQLPSPMRHSGPHIAAHEAQN
jgi:hypothetical protein